MTQLALNFSARARRNRGKAVGVANHAADLALARRLALELLAQRGVGTIADVRDYAAASGYDLPWHLPWTGSVFLPHRKDEAWFEPTGERENTRHVRGNCRKVNQYRLTDAGAKEARGLMYKGAKGVQPTNGQEETQGN
jgi:hypothetical protein